MKKLIPIFLIFCVVAIFFSSFLVRNLLPIPSDALSGLYHPFRDFYAATFPRGIPFKNALITDPVRQEYPWRFLSITLEKKLQLPLWNPYSFSGTPLLANFQSAAFYPFNLLFFIFPFPFAWSLLIFLQPILAGIFLYLYLRNLKLHSLAAFLGGISFAFCGFSIAWLEWDTVIQTALWLPLMLLSIDKIFFHLSKSKHMIWFFVLLLSLVSAFFAGHLQIFFYLFIVIFSYGVGKLLVSKKYKKFFLLFSPLLLLFLLLTIIQWLPTLQFIQLSARDVDQSEWQVAGWFVPWQNLIQFVVPDFFGNPATLNYWGIWNYGEFIGFIGIFPLLMAMFAFLFRRDKKTYFFTSFAFIALLFSLPTFIAKMPFILHIPFISTSQPTRLMFVVDFSLCVLAALGLDFYMRKKGKILVSLSILGSIFAGIWLFLLLHTKLLPHLPLEHVAVAKSNILFPTIIFIGISGVILFGEFLKEKIPTKLKNSIFVLLIIISIFDLLRFGQKFTPFTQNQYLFPTTKSIMYLQRNIGNYRVMTADSRLFAPNFSVMYKLQSIEGYDPLYVKRYAEFIAASQREKPDISSPFGFNRIITPHVYTNTFVNLLGVKYVMSLDDIFLAQFKKVYQEGQTRIYENSNVLPRAFFVKNVIVAQNKQDAMTKLFAIKDSLSDIAVVEASLEKNEFSQGEVHITSYKENKVTLLSKNPNEGFLMITDIYYPTWRAYIDGKQVRIFQADYALRGVIVPSGNHTIKFEDKLF